MNTDEIASVLPKLFKQTNISPHAKEKLRQRLFGVVELSDDDLLLVSAAGSKEQQQVKRQEILPD